MFTGNGAGVDGFSPNYGKDPITTTCKQGAWDLTLAPALRVTANSNVVSLYVEPSLGLQIFKQEAQPKKLKNFTV